jgi:hypothetical protein
MVLERAAHLPRGRPVTAPSALWEQIAQVTNFSYVRRAAEAMSTGGEIVSVSRKLYDDGDDVAAYWLEKFGPNALTAYSWMVGQ